MSEPRLRPWRILNSDYRIQTKFLRLRADRVELPNGAVVDDYFVRESRGFCVVFALTPDENVLLVRQYKHGAREIVTELPAGMIDDGETPEACAVRELAEETGYTGAAPRHIRTFLSDPTNATGRFYLYVVRDAVRTREPVFDVTEEIEVELAPVDEVRAMALDGRIAAGSQVAAVLVALAHLGR
ncbi:MAG TPA: NUDIX hydrolase [Candidatus Elarobacter sp.]|jgi:8-oxo-dGTP pyrophosphatase MutT (NUDIX family)|nr:NUDIX hydrolase [Candidatus Elarobacter sp.]